MTVTDTENQRLRAELDALRLRLEAEAERRRARDRDLVEQTARTREAEARLDAVRQTMAFGLGQALVDALKLPGLVRLPAKIVELRQRQKEKRGWQTTHAVEQRPADEMRLVSPALDKFASHGADVAVAWIEGRPRRLRQAKARALAELGLALAETDPVAAAAASRRALALHPGEGRVVPLALRLHDLGLVSAPAELLKGVAEGALTPGAMARWAEIAREAEWLRHGLAFPARAAVPSGGAETRIVLGDIGRDADEAERASATGCPIIVDIGWLPRALFDPEGWETRRAGEAWLRGMLAVADRVVVRGPAFAEVAKRLGARATQILPDPTVPPPLLQPEERIELRRAFRIPDGRTVLACPVTLDSDPGLAALIDALAGQAGIVVLFCGTGPGMPLLARQAAMLGLAGSVVFTGALPPSQRAAALAIADAIVLPKRDAGAIAGDTQAAFAQAAGVGVPLILSIETWHWRTIADDACTPILFEQATGLGQAIAAITHAA